MSKSILRLMATLLVAMGLMTGLVATVGAQDSNGNINIGQDNDNYSDQDNYNYSDQYQDQYQDSNQDNDGYNDLNVGGSGGYNYCGQYTEGGGDRTDSTTCSTGDSDSTNGDTNQANSGTNTNSQGATQDNDTTQGNDNDTTQGNTGTVSDIGGDDSSTTDNSINGDDNTVGDGAIIGLLIAMLLAMMTS